jgi:hypothetical protein
MFRELGIREHENKCLIMTVLEEVEQARQQSRSGKVYSNSEAKEIL